jgi:hypothetical protein
MKNRRRKQGRKEGRNLRNPKITSFITEKLSYFLIPPSEEGGRWKVFAS